MRLEVHRRLEEMRTALGMEFGKCVQKLLALAFLQAKAKRLTDRGVQGIDLEVTLENGRRVAVEVKTTEGSKLSVGDKDLRGLDARREEGCEPFLAVLGPHLLDDWIFARVMRGEIRAQEQIPTILLRAYRDRALEAVVAETFPAVVLAHGAAAAAGGQGPLDALLRACPAYAIA